MSDSTPAPGPLSYGVAVAVGALVYVVLWAFVRAVTRLVRRREHWLADLRRHAPLLAALAIFAGT